MAAPAYLARSYAGGAPVATISAPMGSTDTSFTISPTTGWTSADGHALGTDGPFVIDIDRGLASEEKILCTSINLGTGLVQVYNTGGFLGRGYDQTSATTHTPSAGSPLAGACQVVWTAVEALEANTAVSYVLGHAGGTQATGQVLAWGSGGAPIWENPLPVGLPVCRVKRSAVYNAPNTAPTTAPYDTVIKDTTSGFNISTGLYTVSVAGDYRCTSSWGRFAASGTADFMLSAAMLNAVGIGTTTCNIGDTLGCQYVDGGGGSALTPSPVIHYMDNEYVTK